MKEPGTYWRRLGALALVPFLVAGAAQVVLAMGMSGGRSVINPPIDFRATLTDRDGVRVDVSQLNIGGDIQLEGTMGRGSLRIPFDNIEAVSFGADSQDHSRAVVQLKNKESITLRVRNSLLFYGQTSMGIYQVRARDLQSVQFLP